MVIVTKNKDKKVELFEIPEDQLAKYKVGQAHTDDSECNKEAIDLYKMEYETCAKRYNNLYGAAWTNFSYMALFAGGIFTFGGTRLVIPLTAFLACLPLLFWWVATFEPLNRYGDQVQKDLGDIEKALNALCFVSTSIASQNSGTDRVQIRQKGLTHFQDFAKREQGQLSVPKAFAKRLIAGFLFAGVLMFSLHTFLNFAIPGLTAISIGALVISIVFAFVFLKFRRKSGLDGALSSEALTVPVREEKRIYEGQKIVDGVVIAIQKPIPRVRDVVRTVGCLLLITAICFGVQVGQMIKSEQPLTVPTSEAPALLTH